jgi:hemophore-related protein
MVTLSLTRLVVAVGGAALALSAGAGLASAQPDDPAVNTTCTYPQVIAALNALPDPAPAAQFNSSPMAQSALRRFLAAPPPQRQQMLQQLQASPTGAQYYGTIEQVAQTCNNY